MRFAKICGGLVAILLGGSAADAQRRPACPSREVTTTAVRHPNARSIAAHWHNLAAMPNAADILILGDSHAENWPSKAWAPLSVVKAGSAGDMIENLLWRLQAIQWNTIVPRNVVVIIGSNNLARGDCAFAIVEGVSKILKRTRELWPQAKLLYVGIPPRGPRGSLRAPERVAINAALRDAGTMAYVNKIDPDASVEGCGGCSQLDQIHLSAAGYIALTERLKLLLR